MSIEDRRLAIWLSLLTFVCYAWFYAGGGWNQNALFDLTRAIVERHTFAIDAYAFNTGDVSRFGGHVYSNKAPGLSWLAVLVYAPLFLIERAASIDVQASAVLTFNMYVCTLAWVALPASLVPALLYRFGRTRGHGAAWCATVALTIALATQMLPYSTIFMLHVPSGAVMLLSLMFAVRERSVALKRNWAASASGFCGALAATVNYVCLPVMAFSAWSLWRATERTARRRRLAQFVVAGALPLLALAAYQRICFGSAGATSIAHTDERFLDHSALLGVFHLPSLEAMFGITFSAYRGLFYIAPVLLVAVAALVVWRREERDLRMTVAGMTLLFFAVNASFNGWEGGFAIGSRYLVPVIPLLGLALLQCRGLLRNVMRVLAVLSFAINFAVTAVDPQPSGTIPRPLDQYVLPLFLTGHFSPHVPITPPWSAATFTGHTSVNRVTPDEPVVFMFHPPGSPESEWASFNLGEAFFEPGDLRSLIPLALILLIGTLAIFRKARQIDTALDS
jgi:hypothetical protein